MKAKNKIITLENILCFFIILCPILDIISFTFRNYFKTEISVTTFLRPIIPIIVAIFIFFQVNKKEKKTLILISILYIVYAIIHLCITKKFIKDSSYGTVSHEMQYIFNFTFLIIDLIIYLYVFIVKKSDNDNQMEKLKKSITIMVDIYMVSILLSIITKTSSTTYITGTGYKGWIESGNSLSAILVISLFIIFSMIKTSNKKWKIISILTIAITGVYLTTIIGTRTGLIGFFIVVATYILSEVILSKNKKIIIIGGIVFIILLSIILIKGSNTIQRRKQMEESKYTIIDEATGQVGNMTGDMLKLKNEILNGTLKENYLSEAQKQSVLELFQYTKQHNIAGNDTRTQQLIYNMYLTKNQKSILGILFGNGYEANLSEMVMENELASLVLNFGIIGFTIYIVPFIAILLISIIEGIKNIKKISSNYIMYQCGAGLVLVLSWLSGYVFFATSNMVIISGIYMLLLNETIKLKHKNEKIIKNENTKSSKKLINI